MLKHISRNRLVAVWFAATVAAAASLVAIGANVAVSTTALLLAMSLVPPAIVWLVWRGAPPPTVGEILYATSTPKPGRA
jgi:hypothetical protein